MFSTAVLIGGTEKSKQSCKLNRNYSKIAAGGRLTSSLFAKPGDQNINPSTGTDREEDLNLGPPD